MYLSMQNNITLQISVTPCKMDILCLLRTRLEMNFEGNDKCFSLQMYYLSIV